MGQAGTATASQAEPLVLARPWWPLSPVAKGLFKSFIFSRFNSIQTLKIHIYLNIAPKILKPILLDS
jgi:hypothetical protein